MHTIIWQGLRWPYVVRPPTISEECRFIGNGYEPPKLVREPDASVYQYLRADLPPNYPVPATLMNADAATIYWWLCGHCPIDGGPCTECINEYVDALEYHKHWED